MTDRKLTYALAFNEAVRQAMEADADVFCAGEDIGAFGGVFRTYAGLQATFGADRVVDTPISEQAIIGLGIGAAVTGLRPIVDLMFMDFICVAMDQIVNQAAKLKYMFGGDATLPLTITTAGGAGLIGRGPAQPVAGGAAVPHPRSEGGVPLEPVRHEGPDDGLHPRGQPHGDGEAQAAAGHERGGARGALRHPARHAPHIARPGNDVTVVAYGRMLNESLVAAEQLATEGIDCEVIDPRTLQPLDTPTIVASVRRTNRVIVVHEAVRFGGLGAEIAAQIQEEAFDYPRCARRTSRRSVLTRALQPGARAALRARCCQHRRRHPRGDGPTAGGELNRAGRSVSTVGVIVNPIAGKDIRRLVSAASHTSDSVKIGIVRRVVIAACRGRGPAGACSVPTHITSRDRAVDGARPADGGPRRADHRLAIRHRRCSNSDVEGECRSGGGTRR